MGSRQDCRAKNWDLGVWWEWCKGRRGEKCEKGRLGGTWGNGMIGIKEGLLGEQGSTHLN